MTHTGILLVYGRLFVKNVRIFLCKVNNIILYEVGLFQVSLDPPKSD